MRLFTPFLAGIICFYLSTYFPLLLSIGFLISIIVLIRKKEVLLILIVLTAFLYASSKQQPEIAPFVCSDSIVGGHITDASAKSDFGYMQTLKVSMISDCDVDIRGREIKLYSSEPIIAGSEGVFLADIKGRYRYQNPGSFRHDMSITASVRDIHYIKIKKNLTWLIQNERSKLISFLEDEFTGDVEAFLSAIVTGNRRDMPDRMRKGFASAGLSHLLAISGAHFGVFSFLVFSCFKFLIKRMPYPVLNRMVLYVTPSELSAVFTIPFMIFYLFLSGAGIPAVRSFIMINVFLFGFLLGRKGTWKNSVAFAAFILLMISPGAILDVSFILSFTAVIFIGFALQWKRERDDGIFIPGIEENILEKLKRWITVTFIIAVAAYIGTMPFVLYFFHSMSVISPLTNMVIAPFICFLIIPIAVLGSLVYLVFGFFPLSGVLYFLSDNVLWLIYSIDRFHFIRLTAPAFPLIIIVIFYIGLSLLITLRRKIYGIGLSLLCVFIAIAFPYLQEDNCLEMTFLDVGQAESSVIVFPDKRVMVIDTGKSGRQTVGYLDYLGVDKIDMLVLSHSGYDHAGGLVYVTEMKDVKMLLDNGRIIYTPHLLYDVEHILLNRGDVVEGVGYSIEALHPYKGFYTLYGSKASEDNNESLVLRIKVGERRILFTGDIEEEAEDDIVHLGDYLKSDILKIAHHGSRTSSSGKFISLANPSIAVISAGMFNSYGHPHEETINKLSGAKVLQTSRDGAVKIISRGKDGKLPIKTFEQYRFRHAENIIDEIENLKKFFIVW